MNATILSLVLATVLAPPAKTSTERSTRIYVRTTPPGASIVLDGKELGTSDGLFLVPPGVRTITLEMDGYDPEGRSVDVKEGWITRVEVRMEQKAQTPSDAIPSTAAADRPQQLIPLLFDVEGTPILDGKPTTLDNVRIRFAALEHPESVTVSLRVPRDVPYKKCQELLSQVTKWQEELGLGALRLEVVADESGEAVGLEEEANVSWALLTIDSNQLNGKPLTTSQVTAALCHQDDESIRKLVLYGRPGISSEAYRKALATGYELTHRHGLWALITPGIEEATEGRAFPPLGMRYISWEIKDDASMEFGERPATIETIREDLDGRYAEEATKLVLLLECPAGSLFEEQEKNIDQAFEWQREFGLAGVGLGIQSSTRPGRLEDRRVVHWTVRSDGTEMELTARVKENYGAYARQTWNTTLDEIPTILESLPNRERRVLEIGFTQEVPDEISRELTKLAAEWSEELGFWYGCDLGGARILPNGKRSWAPYVVRWVIQDKDTMTFEGERVAPGELPRLLRTIPNRQKTILELGYDPRISVKMRNEYVGQATVLARQFGFKYASDVGEQKLGSKGSPPQTVRGSDEEKAGDDGRLAHVEQGLLHDKLTLEEKLQHYGENHATIRELRHRIQTTETYLANHGGVAGKGDLSSSDLELAKAEILQLVDDHLAGLLLEAESAGMDLKAWSRGQTVRLPVGSRKSMSDIRRWQLERARIVAAGEDQEGRPVPPQIYFERTIHDLDEGEGQEAIDLDTGTVHNIPIGIEGWEPARWREWFELGGIDLIADHANNQWALGLVPPAMTLVPADDEEVKAGVAEVLGEKDKRLADVTMHHEEGIDFLLLPEGSKPPLSFVFRTTQGTEGVLRIMAWQEKKPKSMDLVGQVANGTGLSRFLAPSVFQGLRKIRLPDADTEDTPIVVDLASGEMLKLPPSRDDGGGDVAHFTKLGKGDIGFDSMLFCLRGGKVEEMKDGAIRPIDVGKRMGDATLYPLPALPCELLVTTAEKRQFLVSVLNETAEGAIDIEYREQQRTPEIPEVAEEATAPATTQATEGVDTDARMKIREAQTQMAVIEAAMERYYLDTGRLLSMKHGFHALLRCPDDIADPESWNGPYLKTPDGSVPVDPWGNVFLCGKQGTGDKEIRGILSFGPDGKGGTADDLRNWDPDDYRRIIPEPDLTTGLLEFRVVATADEAKAFEETGEGLSWYKSLMKEAHPLPTRKQDGQAEILLWQTPEKSMTRGDGEEKEWRVIEVSIMAEPNKPGRIGVVFDQEGGRRLKKLTGTNVNRHMAMLVDGRVVSCPIIRAAIGPRVELTGDLSKQELTRLATALQAGMETSRPEVPETDR